MEIKMIQKFLLLFIYLLALGCASNSNQSTKNQRFISYHPIIEKNESRTGNPCKFEYAYQIAFRKIEENKMPSQIKKKGSFVLKDLKIEDAIKKIKETTHLKIKSNIVLSDEETMDITIKDLPIYASFHLIAEYFQIGWGIKGNTIYFGRDLREMDYIGAQYSDEYQKY